MRSTYGWVSSALGFWVSLPLLGLYTPTETPFEIAFISTYTLAAHKLRISKKKNQPVWGGPPTDTQSFLPLKTQSFSDDHSPSGHYWGPIDYRALYLQEIFVEDLVEVKVSALGALHFFRRSIGELVDARGAPFPLLGGREPGRSSVGYLGAVRSPG